MGRETKSKKTAPKIVAFATLKGGTGKTTNCYNIAGCLAKQFSRKKILAVDIDPQGDLTCNFGIDNIGSDHSLSVLSIFKYLPSQQPSIDKIIIKSPIKELQNIDVLPATISMFLEEDILNTRPDRERVLQKYFEKNKDYLTNYDYILIDTNPSMNIFNVNAFLVADSIILNTSISANEFNGGAVFCQLWDEKREQLGKEDNICALIISNVDTQYKIGREMIEYAQKEGYSKDICMETIITHGATVKNAELANKPVCVYAPSLKITELYNELTKELIKKGVL